MKLTESFNISFRSMSANKTRTFLTTLGVIIGVMAIVLLLSVITGTRAEIENEIISIGSNVFAVSPGNIEQTQGADAFIVNRLRLKHVERLESRSSYAAVAVPEYDVLGLTAKYRSESRVVSYLIGVSEKFPYVYNWKIQEGRFFGQKDVDGARKVVVVGKTIVNDLFLGTNPIGKELTVKGVKFEVIGVLESKGKMFGADLDDSVVMPISSAQRLTGADQITQINIKVPNPADVEKAMLESKRLLLMDLESKDFSLTSQSEWLKLFNTFANILAIVTFAIAGISLLVGGIGIMNIMLVSVTERIREIGIRKSVGATFRDILSQFMVESTIIAVSGALLGVLISVGIISLIAPFLPFPLKPSLTSIVLSISFSIVIGVFFGTYPAVKAAKTDPIYALRYE